MPAGTLLRGAESLGGALERIGEIRRGEPKRRAEVAEIESRTQERENDPLNLVAGLAKQAMDDPSKENIEAYNKAYGYAENYMKLKYRYKNMLSNLQDKGWEPDKPEVVNKIPTTEILKGLESPEEWEERTGRSLERKGFLGIGGALGLGDLDEGQSNVQEYLTELKSKLTENFRGPALSAFHESVRESAFDNIKTSILEDGALWAEHPTDPDKPYADFPLLVPMGREYVKGKTKGRKPIPPGLEMKKKKAPVKRKKKAKESLETLPEGERKEIIWARDNPDHPAAKPILEEARKRGIINAGGK